MARAKLDINDYDDVRRAVSALQERHGKSVRDLLLKRRGISIADFEAPDVRVPLQKWADLSETGGAAHMPRYTSPAGTVSCARLR